MKCPNCGAKLKENDRVCPACGRALNGAAPVRAKKKTSPAAWIGLALLLAALLIGGALLYPKLAARYREKNRAAAPTAANEAGGRPAEYRLERDFIVYDADRNQVRLSDFAGKPVVVNFWTTWCGYCVRELGDFQQAYSRCGDEVAFLMVDLTDGENETVERARAFMASNGYTMPTYYDLAGSAAAAYSISAIPVTLVLDAAGRQVDLHIGAMDGETLDGLIRSAIQASAD